MVVVVVVLGSRLTAVVVTSPPPVVLVEDDEPVLPEPLVLPEPPELSGSESDPVSLMPESTGPSPEGSEPAVPSC